ncbi:MAG: EI24 domain-containing protein, partial [Desulfobulbaceae bacterium]|nr:EI24 domain-containing protein [Desulfobulbaceae bacterium]
LAFTLRALCLNLLILPLYLVGVGFIASIILNSYLLGREFFEAASGYHLGKPQARKQASRYRGTIYGGGLVITLMTLVPMLNLMMPILATVWMVHVYHGLPDGGNGPQDMV